MILIALHAPAEGGKTTAAEMLVKHYGFKRISFAAPLYDMLEAGGFGRPKTSAEKEAIIPGLGFSWRHAAQTLGTEWGRRCLSESIWTDLALRKCSDINGRYVIDDCRFENEAHAVRAACGTVVHIRGRVSAHVGDAAKKHESEKGIRFMEHEDYVLNNSGTLQDLQRHLEAMVYAVTSG
jgi:hypothetical protein